MVASSSTSIRAKPVTNFPALPELASGELARRLADQADHFGAELAEYEAVEHVGRQDGQFRLRTDKRELRADSLILALGLGRFTPRKLGLSSEDRFLGSGLTYRPPKLEEITAKRVVIVGGGDSAVDTALSLDGRSGRHPGAPARGTARVRALASAPA